MLSWQTFESCSSARATATKAENLPAFNYPYGLDSNAKPEFKAQYTRGFLLYKEHCANCHGPNDTKPHADTFNDAQLLNYNLRISSEHMAVFRRSSVTEEELNMIMTFLRYRKDA